MKMCCVKLYIINFVNILCDWFNAISIFSIKNVYSKLPPSHIFSVYEKNILLFFQAEENIIIQKKIEKERRAIRGKYNNNKTNPPIKVIVIYFKVIMLHFCYHVFDTTCIYLKSNSS